MFVELKRRNCRLVSNGGVASRTQYFYGRKNVYVLRHYYSQWLHSTKIKIKLFTVKPSTVIAAFRIYDILLLLSSPFYIAKIIVYIYISEREVHNKYI